ncbi:glycosyltransferase family 9 protein [Phenylobacterium sp.]|jgi:hypothetical protein|uniref:glycosyltransferase family 9 protein n=1 Tax=Phenylobacterium sp. TaxID=1871053 RepID=UPI002F91F697
MSTQPVVTDAREAAERLRRLAYDAWRERRFEAAERLYRLALGYGAQVKMALGVVLLAQGRLEEAWPLYDERENRLRVVRQRLRTPEWRGEDLAGKRLAVWREQGFGDEILFSRFLPRLGGAVTYIGDPDLERLFRTLGVDYRATTEGASLDGFDFWVAATSIPGRLGVTARDVPRPPYLAAAPRQAGGRIGVMASGNPANPNQAYRALPAEYADELLALPGAIHLAPEATGARDFLDTAEIIAGLDVVVSVDTSVAHLAAAMGKRCFVLLSAHRLDWVWDAGLWYPDARLFRQPAPGDWRSVIDEVKAALASI